MSGSQARRPGKYCRSKWPFLGPMAGKSAISAPFRVNPEGDIARAVPALAWWISAVPFSKHRVRRIPHPASCRLLALVCFAVRDSSHLHDQLCDLLIAQCLNVFAHMPKYIVPDVIDTFLAAFDFH